ncbi:hypothetical protein [Prosthecobacter sp.]|uniref:hypothetical protein n=1 Tax=Prosthecobacter sp. TaxID=1965333 RepID=UPI002AB89682|nr:hypothetical protein [Prosthecobacter sp.]MDZ4403912.1 hypothetical protein [Prosthecobacter sp.]
MRLLLFLHCLLFLPSCVHLLTTRFEYKATSPAQSVGGSAFRAEFIPQHSESGIALSAVVLGGAVVAEIGPYLIRMHAFGKDGDQRWFEIKRLRITSSDHFEAPMEARGFEGRAEFKPTNTAGLTRASLLLGPHVHLDTRKQRNIVLEADVEVMRSGGLARGTLRIPLSLSKTNRRDSTFICAELWHDMRHRDNMDIPSALPPPPESP